MPDRRALLGAIAAACLSVGLTACGDLPTPFKGNPGATAMRLAQPPAPLLAVVTPDPAAMPAALGTAVTDSLATALQAVDVPARAKRPQPTDWQLLIRGEARNGTVVPIFTVRDPTGQEAGSIDGSPIPASLWEAASPDLARNIAAEAAPRVSALLTGIRIQRDQANPDSLVNRPAKVTVTEVTGAPGDGNSALTRHIRAHLTEYGNVVQIGREGADFEVRGEVVVTPQPSGLQRVEIVWTILTGLGDERGKVVQLNEVPPGTLDHYWGDIAAVVGQEAAGGINDVIVKQSGKGAVPPEIAPAAAPAMPVEEAEPLPEPPPPPPAAPPSRGKRKKAAPGA